MTYYAVVDTNVLVSSMLKADSIPGKILNLIKGETIIPLINEEIVNEYIEVLTRNKFDLNLKEIEESIGLFKAKGIYLEREQRLEILSIKTISFFMGLL